MFYDFLTCYGLVQSTAEPCVYHQKDHDGITTVCVWVDDALVCSSKGEKQNDIIHFLQTQFKMTSGCVDCFVGLEVTRRRSEKTIQITQHNYIQNMLHKFGMFECKPSKTPTDPHTKLLAGHPEEKMIDQESSEKPLDVYSMQPHVRART